MKLEKATIAAGITGVEIMILEILKNRFFQNMTRHPDLEWEFVEARLSESKEALEVLRLMEESGGEPDTIGIDETSGKLIFCDW